MAMIGNILERGFVTAADLVAVVFCAPGGIAVKGSAPSSPAASGSAARFAGLESAVSGAAANKATEAALAAYPGGVVDRVVQLSNGEYEVHNIGVNWPHHIFVNQSFKVVGAN